MKRENLTEAIHEARIFLSRAQELLDIMDYGMIDHPFTKVSSKHQAACKRTSMDLTRALSKLREV